MLGTLSALVLAASTATPAPVPFDTPPPPDEGAPPLLIRAERVVVRPGVELENASVLVENGVVVAVGEGLEAPEGARVLSGSVVCAGFLDGWSNLGLASDSATDENTDGATRTIDAIDRHSNPEWLADALRGGVVAARLQAGMRARLGGVGAVVRFDPSLGAGHAVVLSDACVQATVGVPRGGRDQDPFQRIGDVDRVKGALDKGKRYAEAWTTYREELAEWEKAIAESVEKLEKDFKKAKKDRDKKQKEAEEKGKDFKEKKYKEDKRPRKPKWDPEDEVLSRVASGEVPLVVEAHRTSEIRTLLDAVEEYGRVRLVILGATGCEPVAETLAERKIPVVLWPSPLGRAQRTGVWADHDVSLAGRLSEAGVEVLLGSGGGDGARDLRLLASLAVGHGLGAEDALHAITLGPARAFDVADRLGSVERGKDADLLVLDGDPLDAGARIQFVITEGRVAVEP